MRSGGIAPHVFTLGTRYGVWLASSSSHFISAETTPVSHWAGVWVGLSPGLDIVAKGKILPSWESKPDTPARSFLLI
jgi:hypothetical protein